MTCELVPVRETLPKALEHLEAEARTEGHCQLDRLVREWTTRINRFDGPGESLLAVFEAGILLGIGGITRDPIDPAALRMRRFYVHPSRRRHGIARRIATTLLRQVQARRVVVNAPAGPPAEFWESLGFTPDRCDGHTHVLVRPDG